MTRIAACHSRKYDVKKPSYTSICAFNHIIFAVQEDIKNGLSEYRRLMIKWTPSEKLDVIERFENNGWYKSMTPSEWYDYLWFVHKYILEKEQCRFVPVCESILYENANFDVVRIDVAFCHPSVNNSYMLDYYINSMFIKRVSIFSDDFIKYRRNLFNVRPPTHPSDDCLVYNAADKYVKDWFGKRLNVS